jgi:cell division protein FtsB
VNDSKPSLKAVSTPVSQAPVVPAHKPAGKPGILSRFSISGQLGRQLVIMVITSIAIYQAGRSIVGSCQRQVYLHQQANALKDGRRQAEEINKELRDGLSSYRSSTGIERLARERLNLAGPDEIVIRIGK